LFVIKVPTRNAEALRRTIAGYLDQDRKIVKSDGDVLFPVRSSIRQWNGLHEALRSAGAEVVDDPGAVFRTRRLEPMINIRNSLAKSLPGELMGQLPGKWELLGDVLVLPIPRSSALADHERTIAAAYAKELSARAVLAPTGPISGVCRVPEMRFLLGDSAVTTHIENGIEYRFDVSRIMFSSGNIDERIRMAGISMEGETVVDMFAGIGYFTLPVAKYTGAARVFACEINPLACDFLRLNIGLNELENVTVLEGDNRETAPVNAADRVIMGYLGTTHEFLPRALAVLKGGRGVIHYHETCPNELMRERPIRRIEGAVKGFCESRGLERETELLNFKKIKSYAPGVSHVVLDVRVG